MASIPYSILISKKENVLPTVTIQEHQNFCKKFLKAHQTFEKYKNNSNSKLAFINDTVLLFNQKKQNQIDVLNWFNSLQEPEKLSLFSIKNKWLINIFTQLFFIFYNMGNYSYKPFSDMSFFFEDQKKYLSKDNSFNILYKFLDSKNIYFNQNLKEKNDNNRQEDEYQFNELNLYCNFFETKEIVDSNYLKSEKREKEIEFIENIRIISLEKDNFDTITFKKEFIMNIDKIKNYLEYFSGDNYFKDWIIPINSKNIYNFVLPSWMHNNQQLSLCQLIIGYFEQKLMVNYEYYYYTKKIYEFPYNKQISELYRENQELVKFIESNYSFHKNKKNKEEILSLEKISKVVDDLRGNETIIKKDRKLKYLFDKICSDKPCYRGSEILFNDELSLKVYNYLNNELLKEKENFISKLVDLITFIPFIDIINFKDNLYYEYRKKIVDSQYNFVLNELKSEGFLNKKNNKKQKKKKKRDNSDNQNKKEEENENQNSKKANTCPIKINIYDVQTKEIECEYNMNSTSNMIQENASNVSINSYNNNNNIFIRGNKKSEEKKTKKVDIPKIEEANINKLDKKEEKEDKILEINEDKKEVKSEEKEEGRKEEKGKIKEKNKKKDFFLYPIIKKKKEENNTNSKNEIKENKVKTKNNKRKKQKKNLKEENIDFQNKNNKNKKMSSFIQERKNNMQINPCPRRKKRVLLKTSSINFEMHMKPSFNSYPYYYSFPMMKPFTSLSEVSTKFSMPSSINNNSQEMKNNFIDHTQKMYWDYSQYNNNYFNNAFQIFNSFTPSEKYFESLDKEINNYLFVTNSNIINLKKIYEEKLEKIELLIRNGLSENYEVKFGHYGSFFSNLSIEGSDLDILVYYHKKNDDVEIFKDILNLLEKDGNDFENICPILTASVPVIKLKIDIKNEIKEKDIKLKYTSYFKEEDLSKIKIDLTFTENEKDFQHSNEIVSFINKSLKEYPKIKPILLIIKRYFREMNMNQSYTGGLCSYSLFLLVLSFCKCNRHCQSATKLLYYLMENFTYFDYCNYCIDVEKENCYILKDKNDNINEKSASDENSSYDTNYELYEKEIYIVDPISKKNVSKSSFKVDEIILTFRKAFNLLYYEGWYYNLNPTNKTNENKNIDNMNELYEYDSSDYMTIKKLFDLKTLSNNFDFYFN